MLLIFFRKRFGWGGRRYPGFKNPKIEVGRVKKGPAWQARGGPRGAWRGADAGRGRHEGPQKKIFFEGFALYINRGEKGAQNG